MASTTITSSSSSAASTSSESVFQKPKSANKQCEFSSAGEMASFIEKEGVDLIDACFVDPLGMWHHCTFAPSQVEESDINKGFAFDGSSIRLFCTVDQSDMVMKPDPRSCWLDPFQGDHKVLHVTCSVEDPQGNKFKRCPRNTAERAVEFMKNSGIADTAFFGPEAEFFVFDDVRYSCSTNNVSFSVDHTEGYWNVDKRTTDGSGCGNLAHRQGPKRYYFPVPPIDSTMSLRNEMLLTMGAVGLPIEKHHHEVACAQHELGYSCRPLVECADMLMTYKYVIKNVAKKYNKTATFMPKPLHGDNGTGMHCHQSLWKDGVNLFWDANGKYQKLSEMAIWYIGGLLKHAPAVLAFTNSTVNSYKRLVPGYEAPVNLAYSKGNRSAAIRIPLADADNPKAKRLEFRCPDAAGNPYICFAVMLMAGIDGIRNKIQPPPPMDCDIYELAASQRKSIASTPGSLGEVLDALEKDQQFLVQGGVFTEDFIKAYIDLKREEVCAVSLVPHPKEYELYFNC
eukprot:GHVS01081581.1.p1 GENE.GHVS01081581.1~~GHVS01081581.1.p1  ORF type:complete len:511 (+),score=53.59 GHVS01081581.1:359-1891(+)